MDVLLEHPSISRKHAILQHGQNGEKRQSRERARSRVFGRCASSRLLERVFWDAETLQTVC